MAAGWTDRLRHSRGDAKPEPSRQGVDDVRTSWHAPSGAKKREIFSHQGAPLP